MSTGLVQGRWMDFNAAYEAGGANRFDGRHVAATGDGVGETRHVRRARADRPQAAADCPRGGYARVLHLHTPVAPPPISYERSGARPQVVAKHGRLQCNNVAAERGAARAQPP